MIRGNEDLMTNETTQESLQLRLDEPFNSQVYLHLGTSLFSLFHCLIPYAASLRQLLISTYRGTRSTFAFVHQRFLLHDVHSILDSLTSHQHQTSQHGSSRVIVQCWAQWRQSLNRWCPCRLRITLVGASLESCVLRLISMPVYSRVEKYRPVFLDDIVGNTETIERLKIIAKDGNMPHVIISGMPGIGKTTSVLCLARQLLGDAYKEAVLELNASDERGSIVYFEKSWRFQAEVTFQESTWFAIGSRASLKRRSPCPQVGTSLSFLMKQIGKL